MFDYVVTEYGPAPDFVLQPVPPPPGRLARHVFDSTSVVLDLPADEASLRCLRSGQFWKGLRRRQRRFEESHGVWEFRVCTTPEEIDRALPAVRGLFAERWAGRHTSLPWHTETGFAPWGVAFTGLAARGAAAFALLESGGRLLAFSCLLLEPPWCHAWQHASTPQPAFRTYSLGTQLDVATFRWLMSERPDIAHYDFMLGDDPYKRDWESWRRPVYRRFEQPATVTGLLRLTAGVAAHRLRCTIRRQPRLHSTLQKAAAAMTWRMPRWELGASSPRLGDRP